MLDKIDLTAFYSKLAATNEIFKTIIQTNSRLEKEYGMDIKPKELEIDSSGLEPVQRYILSNVKTKEFKLAVTHAMLYMNECGFKKISSVPNNATLTTEIASINDYEILSKVNLSNHSLNSAICALEVCKEQPQVIRDIVVLLSLLHDFGKSPVVQKQYKDKNEKHDQTSARFANDFLPQFGIIDDLINTIFLTLNNHHNEDEKAKNITIYLPLLIASDNAARIIEKKFIRRKRS